MDHLVIPDPHAVPGVPNDRFDWLGRLIVDRKPEKIICLGDFADMESLSSYDRGKKSFEGRRIIKDIEVTIDAQDRIFRPLKEYNEQRRKNKEKQYKPDFYLLGGNHDEGRIEKAVQASPELDGLITLSHLCYDTYNWCYVPYREPIVIDGIAYCHHFPTGVSGEPISGEYLARSLLMKNHMSSTVGHSHILNIAHSSRSDGKRMWGLSAGCYFEHTPEFAKDTAKFWWRGLVHKHNVVDGDYDLELLSIESIKRAYNG